MAGQTHLNPNTRRTLHDGVRKSNAVTLIHGIFLYPSEPVSP